MNVACRLRHQLQFASNDPSRVSPSAICQLAIKVIVQLSFPLCSLPERRVSQKTELGGTNGTLKVTHFLPRPDLIVVEQIMTTNFSRRGTGLQRALPSNA
jgi:hypothetical protein